MNKKWSPIILFLISIFATMIPAHSEEWRTPEIIKMENEFHELAAQVKTLEIYDPEKFPDFQQLEKLNQLVEQMEFNKRKFDLLIKQYNILEDELFPAILSYYKSHGGKQNEIMSLLTHYTGSSETSIFKLQEQINTIALMNERLEKRIEFIQVTSKDKAMADEFKEKMAMGKQILEISRQIVQLEEEKKNLLVKKEDEQKKFNSLSEKEAKQTKKIQEKKLEIQNLQDKIETTNDRILKLANQTSAQVREIRLNGLEIPRLNATKTFKYLSDTAIKTYTAQIEDIEKEITSLKQQKKEEIIEKLIKAAIVISIAFIICILIIRIARMIGKRIVKRVESSDKIDVHNKQRYHTLSAVTLSFIKVVTWAVAMIWVLSELNINVGPILVAAGGVSLAIGFGAQSLVKDVVSGFFILMEKQFALGDFVIINDDSGYIEAISLRTIKMRTLDGSLHIIHNGSINKVANQTYEWSRAVVNIRVGINEEPAKVLRVLQEVCESLNNDEEWKPKLIDKPFPQGIISLGECSSDFRILAKTIPDLQWAVEREIRIRVRNALSQNAIETPSQFITVIDRKPIQS